MSLVCRNGRTLVKLLLLQLSALHICALVPLTTPSPHHSSRLIAKDGSLSRRALVASIIAASAASFLAVPVVKASETVGKDPDCNDSTCLGVWDGLLADCPHGPGASVMGSATCVASQDDTPGIFAEPWDYSESDSMDYNEQMKLLLPTIQLVSSRRGDPVRLLVQNGRYLRVLFTDGKTGQDSAGEFYFTPNDTTVQFRVGATTAGQSGFLSQSQSNLERCEEIRKQMRYLKLPVLRNRKLALSFGESVLDTFGPGSAALGPPAEMTTGELEGRQDVDPRRKIDFLQNFPTTGRPMQR
jgi:uncharacterized membrane protein